MSQSPKAIFYTIFTTTLHFVWAVVRDALDGIHNGLGLWIYLDIDPVPLLTKGHVVFVVQTLDCFS